LFFEPDAQRREQWAALSLTHGKTFNLARAAHPRLDLIERRYALERLGRDRRRLGFGQIIKATAHMTPAKHQCHALLIGLGPNQLFVGVIPVALQDAAVATEQSLGMMMTTAGRVAVDDGGRLAAAPRPIITRDGPEVTLLGPPTARIEHRHDGLVGKQSCRTQHDLSEPGDHGGKLGRRVAHPERQSRAIEDHALPRHDLRLAIQRQVIGIARDQHVGDKGFGRDAALDQPGRRGHLHHRTATGPANEFRTLRHDDPELGRDHIQPLGAVFPDHRHRHLAARACRVLGCQRHLDARQMRRQSPAAGPAFGDAILVQFGIALLRLGLTAGDCLLERFEAELQLLLRQTFRFGAELHAFELQQQVTNSVVLLLQGVAFADHSITFANRGVTFGNQRQNQSAQAFHIVGQAQARGLFGVHRTRILCGG
jgi:hypothetical protein